MLICSIYKSSKKDEMYLYVDKREGLERVPDALIEIFGTPVHSMDMPLTAERKLARADTAKVLESIRDQGFYLQIPPPKEDYMLDIHMDRPETGVR